MDKGYWCAIWLVAVFGCQIHDAKVRVKNRLPHDVTIFGKVSEVNELYTFGSVVALDSSRMGVPRGGIKWEAFLEDRDTLFLKAYDKDSSEKYFDFVEKTFINDLQPVWSRGVTKSELIQSNWTIVIE
jgi:hypothetical protein